MDSASPMTCALAPIALGLAGLLGAGQADAQASVSDLALEATLVPPAPWVQSQRVALTVTARNLRSTPAEARLFVIQPQRPGIVVGGDLIGQGLPSSTCQRDILCSEFGNNCWIIGTLQGFESRTCRIDYQVPIDAPVLGGLMHVQLGANPPDIQTSNNNVSFPARTVAVAAIPALSGWSRMAMCGLFVVALWCFRSRQPHSLPHARTSREARRPEARPDGRGPGLR